MIQRYLLQGEVMSKIFDVQNLLGRLASFPMYDSFPVSSTILISGIQDN